VQVDPIKLALQAPGTKRLKLNYVKLLSTFAFKFNLRRYSEAGGRGRDPRVVRHDEEAASKARATRRAAAAAAWKAGTSTLRVNTQTLNPEP